MRHAVYPVFVRKQKDRSAADLQGPAQCIVFSVVRCAVRTSRARGHGGPSITKRVVSRLFALADSWPRQRSAVQPHLRFVWTL